jgi:hypothetical protein
MIYAAKEPQIVIRMYDVGHKRFNSIKLRAAVDFFLLFAACLKASRRNGK